MILKFDLLITYLNGQKLPLSFLTKTTLRPFWGQTLFQVYNLLSDMSLFISLTFLKTLLSHG